MKRLVLMALLFPLSLWGQFAQQAANGLDYTDFAGNGRSYSSAGWLDAGTNYLQTQYPSATIFRESPGNVTNGGPCWSGGTGTAAECQYEWLLTAGSGQSIAASSGCGGGSTLFANAIEMPANTTATGLRAFIPAYIAQSGGTHSHVTFWMCMTTVANVGFAGWFQLGIPSSTSQTINCTWNGSGTAQVNCGASNVSFTAAAWHRIDIVFAGASSYFQIDLGTHNTFTANADDWNTITLIANYNSNSAGTEYFGPMTINGVSSNGTYATTGGWPLVTLSDWAGQSGTPTATSMRAGTHGGNDGWGENGSAVTFSFVTSPTGCGTYSYPGSVWAAGNVYSGNSGVYLQASWTSSQASTNWEDTWNSSISTPYSVGFPWCTDTTVASVSFTDQTGFGASSGWAFHICGSTSTSICTGSVGSFTNLLWCVENSGGTTVGCTPISNTTWYWVTALANPATGSDQTCLYNGSTFAKIACENTSDTGVGYGVLLGDVGAEEPGVSMSSYYGSVMKDPNGSFPLLPWPYGAYAP